MPATIETPAETVLSNLSEQDFAVLASRWARGCDWFVTREGRSWKVMDSFGPFPRFRSKTKAYTAATERFLAENRRRAILAAKDEGLVAA